MIELANDPNASRFFRRTAASGEPKAATSGERRVHSGHPWPFISRYTARPARPESAGKPAAQQGGS